MTDYPMGWSEQCNLERRLQMYRDFSNTNPGNKVGSLVTIILVLRILWTLASLIYYFTQIDDELFHILAAKQAGASYKISPELSEYLEQENVRRNKARKK